MLIRTMLHIVDKDNQTKKLLYMQRLQRAQALSVHVQSIKISALILFKASQ